MSNADIDDTVALAVSVGQPGFGEVASAVIEPLFNGAVGIAALGQTAKAVVLMALDTHTF